MFEFLHSFNLDVWQWLLAIIAVAGIGANKTGIVGINLLSVAILAAIFGGKASTGVLMPFLIMADIFAISHYRKSVRWKHLFTILFWALLGVSAALYVGEIIADEYFRIILAAVIFTLLAMTVLSEMSGKRFHPKKHWYVTIFIGLIGGFTSMIGNAAGPIFTLYFVSLRHTKNEYIATRAWFFFIINLIKIPLHLFVWETINPTTLSFNLVLAPAIFLGAVAGILIVRRIPERGYKVFILTATLVSAIMLLF
ncbi:sulfite exporter TauE/SafE family protein [Marispirochaeta aestuarii]|uniref:sulfite exporter TauE/SafE family protein n=1 Tax=Marispirochaeta aestuarii TaxID=1963862 RepID=UPI0029C85D55|nr:sulfite exporter TauE/SafE family protein [Marispirochaeta aestuarii]